MTRAVVVAMHQYTPFGSEFYEPIFNSFLNTMKKYQDEFDMLYFIDSTWNIGSIEASWGISKARIIKVNPSLRYYDAYKNVLPDIQEDLVLFLDNDMVIYQEGIIAKAFESLDEYDVTSIMDTIGTYTTDKLRLGNKFCPYFFAIPKKLLERYTKVDWSPDAMPYTETFGLLTEALVNDGAKPLEMEDDKTEVKSWNPLTTDKTLGYYHIRSGSTPAYLLVTKHYGVKQTYDNYLKNQPRSELLRHCEWYRYLGGNPQEILEDLG